MQVTNIKTLNAEGTRFSATVGFTEWSGIYAGSEHWHRVQKAIAEGATVAPYVAPPVPDPKTVALEQSDKALMAASARIWEDVISERIAAGKLPEGAANQKVKDIIATRVNLRK